METLLRTEDLSVSFKVKGKTGIAMRKVNIGLDCGETLVVLGESGCGKSTLMKAVLGILPTGAEVSGKVFFDGSELTAMKEKELRRIRGSRIAMIFQNSLSALDPMYRIGDQISETILAHEKVSRRDAAERAVNLLAKVGIPAPAERAKAYPHEMSGGMRQRAVIAMALACSPQILLADEPSTALDVTIQKQILDLFMKLKEENNMGVMFVTHDIGVAAAIADRIAVMYGGIVVESGKASEVLLTPANPYTKALLNSLPVKGKTGRLDTIDGQPPMITALPKGCPFSDRCPCAKEICTAELPTLQPVSSTHSFACHIPLSDLP